MTQEPPKSSPAISAHAATAEFDSELRRYIETAIKPNLQGLPEQKVELVIEEVTTMIATSGPLPPPALAREYEALSPGYIDRSLTIAERSQQATIDALQDERNKNQLYRLIGLTYADALVAMLIVGGVIIAVEANPYVGALTSIACVVASAVTVFVQGRPLADGRDDTKKPDVPSPPPEQKNALPRRGKGKRN